MSELKLRISRNQLTWLFFSIAPVGLTSLPREINKYVGQSGWLTILISAILIIGTVRILLTFAKRYPSKSILYIFRCIVGKWFGSLIFFIIILYMIVGTGLSIRMLVDGVITHILFRTPHWILIIMMTLVVLYPISKGVETIARFNEIIQPLLLMSLLFICFLVINRANLTELQPIISNDLQLYKGVLTSTYTYFYILFIFFFLPYIKNFEILKQGYYRGVSWLTIEILLLFIITVSLFGTVELNFIEYPSIELARLIEFPLFERMEILFLIFWIIYSYSLVVVTLFSGVIGFKELFVRGNNLVWMLVAGSLTFVIAIYPDNFELITRISFIQNQVNLILIFLLFPTLLFIDSLKKKVREND